ncbi:MAG: Zn-dependent hydrolase, glyoxylase [Anaerocolumna sp.]|jgi:glyoxylase-like metal-dependent hydrolase (beta-lactamase superfamily II)|nr:Zn-dependent hydrolase, glyoxylase [Anaerocolumna sp.]
MNQIITLQIPYQYGEKSECIYPVVLLDNKEMILVDCGYTGFLPKIENALKEQGLSPTSLTKIVITHHDHDHMGDLAAFIEKYPLIKVVASSIEAPIVSGEEKSLRLIQAENAQENLPEEKKPFGLAFCELLKSVLPSPVDIKVNDGDAFDWCGGCKIIATPGHTPGHISLLLPGHNTIITGDAAVIEAGKLVVANPGYALNLSEAEKSLEKLLEFRGTTYICYHGGVYKDL